MDRGAWWAMVHGVAQVRYDWSDSMHTCTWYRLQPLGSWWDTEASGVLLGPWHWPLLRLLPPIMTLRGCGLCQRWRMGVGAGRQEVRWAGWDTHAAWRWAQLTHRTRKRVIWPGSSTCGEDVTRWMRTGRGSACLAGVIVLPWVAWGFPGSAVSVPILAAPSVQDQYHLLPDPSMWCDGLAPWTRCSCSLRSVGWGDGVWGWGLWEGIPPDGMSALIRGHEWPCSTLPLLPMWVHSHPSPSRPAPLSQISSLQTCLSFTPPPSVVMPYSSLD